MNKILKRLFPNFSKTRYVQHQGKKIKLLNKNEIKLLEISGEKQKFIEKFEKHVEENYPQHDIWYTIEEISEITKK